MRYLLIFLLLLAPFSYASSTLGNLRSSERHMTLKDFKSVMKANVTAHRNSRKHHRGASMAHNNRFIHQMMQQQHAHGNDTLMNASDTYMRHEAKKQQENYEHNYEMLQNFDAAMSHDQIKKELKKFESKTSSDLEIESKIEHYIEQQKKKEQELSDTISIPFPKEHDPTQQNGSDDTEHSQNSQDSGNAQTEENGDFENPNIPTSMSRSLVWRRR